MFLAGGALLTSGLPADAVARKSKTMRTATRIDGFDSSEFDFQLMRSLGAGNYGGGTPGEIFHARTLIAEGDPAAWVAAFQKQAELVDAMAGEAAKKNHRVSACDHYLRSSMYWRAAEYFSDFRTPEALQRGMASRKAFLSAAERMSHKVSAVEIPFENVKLPGYFMTPAASSGRGRTLIVITGFDGTAEELYFQCGLAGLDRGWNVLLAEGPGQVGCMRLNPDLKFRPDYEKPISAIVEFALARDEVDPNKLALYGISFGGYFVIRAAEHEPRVKALIANSPIVDLFSYMSGFTGDKNANKPPNLTLANVDKIPKAFLPPAAKLSFTNACYRFGVDSFAAWMSRLKEFNASSELASIKCPSLAMTGDGEGVEPNRQLELFASSVSGPCTKRIFTESEGADMHCQVGNLPLSNAVVYDWLDEVL
jgi:dienelactone hydrolase